MCEKLLKAAAVINHDKDICLAWLPLFAIWGESVKIISVWVPALGEHNSIQ